jgi:hypothetical protein
MKTTNTPACYVSIPGNTPGDRIGIVKYKEQGYYQTDFDSTEYTIGQIQDLVRHLNSKLDIPEDVAESMMYASCFGWNVPIADRAHQYFKEEA